MGRCCRFAFDYRITLGLPVMVNLHRFANPNRFMGLSAWILPWASVAALLLFSVGLYLALIGSPADYEQRETVRIMYVHVPAAWMALFSYSFMAAASAVALIWRLSRLLRLVPVSLLFVWLPGLYGASRPGAPGGFGMRA